MSAKAKKIASEFSVENVKLGDIKKLAKEIKKDHELAMELWSTGDYHPRLLSILILDKSLLTQKFIDQLVSDMRKHDEVERNMLSEWFLANQLMKSKKTISLLESWEHNASPVLRRLFWYHQARQRWTGQPSPENTEQLLETLEANLGDEEPEVQWAMNYCAGWIGVYQPKLRSRCIQLGKSIGLYKDEVVARNCTPSYLPEFIKIEVAKRQ